MMAQMIDRRSLKAEMKNLLRDAQVSPKGMTALYFGILIILNLVDMFTSSTGVPLLGTFVSILASLLSMVLSAGFIFYCMTVRRGERAEYLALFDGFSFVGKIILLNIVKNLFIVLWSFLFVIPGFIAMYRYRFALYNLCENPDLGVMEALNMSKQQTLGYKGQLFMLDLSYIGWALLSSVPAIVQMLYIYTCIFMDPLYYMADPMRIYAITLPLPALLQILLTGLWALAAAVLYLPTYQCTELGYFETAKRTSGVGTSSPEGPGRLGDGGCPFDC